MNSTLATDLTEKTASHALLETWGKNERMRHIPTIAWIVDKLDHDLRRRINVLASSNANEAIDTEIKALCKSIERLGDAAKYSRAGGQPQADIATRIDHVITHAVAALNSLDPNLFGRRYPFQSFERSKAEAIYGSLLIVIDRVHRLTQMVRAIDKSVDERLFEVA